ncbi:hypothetical protein HNP90_001798 [Methanococcus maripaludis]|uniref:Uncharacterized protein n=1 Tax=Methanococcus maripaludis TaxID=39152 RepID=A0A7J9PIF6_METMI|nr:hypothetical protein [Methanococcus maripaludis]
MYVMSTDSFVQLITSLIYLAIILGMISTLLNILRK